MAQPKTGKTILLKDVANAIAANHPGLPDRAADRQSAPVTDMARSVNAEVVASTFDEPADRHVKVATLVLGRPKAMVECGHDVVMLDSITRLAVRTTPCSRPAARSLSGGVDANALQKPSASSARKIENGGSLTILATASSTPAPRWTR